MALLETGRTQIARGATLGSARRCVGASSLVFAGAGSIVWLGWRVTHIGMHPIELLMLLLELVGVLSGLAIALGLLRAESPRPRPDDDRRESSRFAFAVADIVERTRSTDLRRDVRAAFRMARHRRRLKLADLAIGGVLVEGPRRLGLIVTLTVALLMGVAPMPVPPPWAVAAALIGLASSSIAQVALAGGRIRFGDRTRSSYAALGEVLWSADRDDVAPRRWVGAVAAVVAINVAVALRGMSDRWTHGLAPMNNDDRIVTMLLAVLVVIGALYTLCTTPSPELTNAHLVSRRLEERTARQSALGAAVCVGVVGMIAGFLPGCLEASDQDPAGVERISDRGGGPIGLIEVGADDR